MTDKEKVRPIYSELQGLLSQASDNKGRNMHEGDKWQWDRVNQLISELKDVTGADTFEPFRIKPRLQQRTEHVAGYSGEYLSVETYRSTLSGMISRLHGTYFSDEPAPFSGQPGVVMNQTQVVSQQVYVQLGMELQKALEKAETNEEKGFVKKVTEGIGTVRSYIDFVLLVTATAESFGISLERIKRLFGG